jgi:hypothetical protein
MDAKRAPQAGGSGGTAAAATAARPRVPLLALGALGAAPSSQQARYAQSSCAVRHGWSAVSHVGAVFALLSQRKMMLVAMQRSLLPRNTGFQWCCRPHCTAPVA